jgi:hypothetical protein
MTTVPLIHSIARMYRSGDMVVILSNLNSATIYIEEWCHVLDTFFWLRIVVLLYL